MAKSKTNQKAVAEQHDTENESYGKVILKSLTINCRNSKHPP